jgi:uncharacterized membrane protein YfcA
VSRRGRILAYGGAVALMLVGGLCGWVVPSLTGEIIRLSLISVALGVVVLLVFYEVGLSEDRERAREEGEREREREQRKPEHEDKESRPWLGRPPRRPG